VHTVAENLLSVDPDVTDSARQLVRIFERRPIGHRLRSEDDEVSVEPWAYLSPIPQAEPVSDCRSHLADRFLKREYAFVADLSPQYPRIGAVGPRVNGPLSTRPGRVEATGVSRDLDPGLLEREPDIRFVHQEIDREDVPFFGE